MQIKESQTKFIDIIKALEEVIITQSGADVFSEIFKLIYAKLADEIGVASGKHKAKFISSKSYEADIQKLFSRATLKWNNIFAPQERFNMGRECLANCVHIFEGINVAQYSLDDATQAFEYILPEVAKKKRGQYFTPEHVIQLMVKILDPKEGQLIIDPACGSGGYLINAIKYINKKKEKGAGLKLSNIYGVDIDDKSFKIAEAIKIIAGDKYSYNLDKIDTISTKLWQELGLKKHSFDCVFTNPPFSGDITKKEVLENYELAQTLREKLRPRMDRHILFFERIFDLLKPGGQAAVVLPQGVLNNKNMASVRKYLLTNAQVLAVVSLDRNIFRPYTDIKTSIVFFKRWEASVDRLLDYPIFMAISEKSGKDHLGRIVYKKDAKNNIILNKDEKPIIDHDLDEIAKKYIDFIKK